ncbi:eCIS core domain-containing protein [Portibacter lacus]|uniref:eCIS core domain-containing protein n=1 Tax=Portibacter lacus TaxID=1099794 RepID=A0AA37SU52_9BACT|nr:DUF4157 domain-containing protein [Portibacter lacus]GLR19674.1 hypothetical protein GCM10007940_42900 [Portibacter lacus]
MTKEYIKSKEPNEYHQGFKLSEREGRSFAPPPLQLKAVYNRQAESTSPQNNSAFQLKKYENQTGMPDQLKTGIENMSGFSLNDVKVHYNSPQPAQLKAHAYAQGTDIHIAPGQEQHLPHEAWHIVQQKQGKVKPTKQVNGKPVNDNTSLEQEADTMGQKALTNK